MNILVTVGTSEYDDLIRHVDEQVGSGLIIDRIVAQIGKGAYIPTNIKFYRYARHETHLRGIDWADIIISTGGAGTLFEMITKNKRVVLVEHKEWSLEAFDPFIKREQVLFCDDLSELYRYITLAKTFKFKTFDMNDRLDFNAVIDELHIDESALHPIEKVMAISAMCCIFATMILIALTLVWMI